MKQKLKTTYFIIANSAILIVAIIMASYLTLNIWYGRERDYYAELKESQKKSYESMPPDEINDILKNTWNSSTGGWDYEEVTGFREHQRKSKYVNVNEFGIRANSIEDLNSFNPDNKIWVFGGSTTWGYGVADNQTIPSHLEKLLNKKTVNFGRGYYYSLQENLLLVTLLKTGYKPDEVIFIDGVNERCAVDVYQKEFSDLFRKAQYTPEQYSIRNMFQPTFEIISKISGFMQPSNSHDIFKFTCSKYGKDQPLALTVKRNLEERAHLCKMHNVKCTTFIQPFAGVDIKTDLLPEYAITSLERKKSILIPTWQEMQAVFIDEQFPDENNAYLVDNIHYSEAANLIIAGRIAKQIN